MPDPRSARRRDAGPALVLAALLGAPALPLPGGAAGAQDLSGFPAAQVARFRLVVEGEASAVADVDLGGDNGGCATQINAHITERATYLRGQGVVVEFVRFAPTRRAPILLRRVGRNGPVSFSVDVAVTRRASGFESRSGAVPEACPPISRDLSESPDCDRTDTSRDTLALTLTPARSLDLTLAPGVLRGVEAIECPLVRTLGDSNTLEPRYGWPTPVPLRDSPPIPLGHIFGTRRAIVIRATAPLGSRQVRRVTAGPVSGSSDDTGRNRVTVRLVRVS